MRRGHLDLVACLPGGFALQVRKPTLHSGSALPGFFAFAAEARDGAVFVVAMALPAALEK
ncbi:hypothetical protein BHS06_34060 [Myxococcus xanthus]|nr:hypothetical protein BHS06_34060 [Myxococcus xanthus]